MRLATKKNRAMSPALRSGRVGAAFLIALPVLVVIVFLPINAALMHKARTTQQVSADAVSLAAVQAFVDDRRLVGSAGINVLIQEAKDEADKYAKRNTTMGKAIKIEPNRDNKSDGDIVFGTWLEDCFCVADLNDSTCVNSIDVVRIVLRRSGKRGNRVGLFGGGFFTLTSTDLDATATAFFDRHVLGFRATEKTNIPMTPIGLRSDKTAMNKHSWEYQVEARHGTDNASYNRKERKFEPGSDGLHEMRVTFGGVPEKDDVERRARINAVLLQIGAGDFRSACMQVVNGINKDDLRDRDAKLVLDADGKLVLPGTPFFTETDVLRNCLQSLQLSGEPRVWPLYSGFMGGQPVIRGFVVARVVRVLDSEPGEGVTFILQPTIISTLTAITVPTRPINEYVGRVRLVH